MAHVGGDFLYLLDPVLVFYKSGEVVSKVFEVALCGQRFYNVVALRLWVVLVAMLVKVQNKTHIQSRVELIEGRDFGYCYIERILKNKKYIGKADKERNAETRA